MKQCSTCLVTKPLSSFYLKRGKPIARCKTCESARVSSYGLRVSPEKNLDATRRFKMNNPDRVRQIEKKSKAKHRSRTATEGARYRAKVASAVGEFTEQEWAALCKEYNYTCLCCFAKTNLTRDHVVPLHLGGNNTIANIQPLCQSCNSSKGIKVIDYRMNWR